MNGDIERQAQLRKAGERELQRVPEINTFRHSRSMQEAFGPYVDSRLEPMPDGPRNKTADVLFAVALGLIGALILIHFLSR
jgi:hypothetical protein